MVVIPSLASKCFGVIVAAAIRISQHGSWRLSLQKPLGSHSLVALIPARHGSKRCPGKNTRRLAGKPLLCHTLELAIACPLFSAIVVSTDDVEAYAYANAAGVEVHQRKPAHATDTACDYLWVQDVMQRRDEEMFCILRPTSPFRTVSTIRRAYARLLGSEADSVRAVEPVRQHPGKMWLEVPGSRYLMPVITATHPDGTPWHSSPTQSLPTYYVQNASLEMAWTRVLAQTQTISGYRIAPFLTDAREGFDINTDADFDEAERLSTAYCPS